jgi:DNA-directed RNA polymerase subunit omega
MARVTIEDCILHTSRFELVILAAQRAKEIGAGAPLSIKKDNDRNAVLALREIAAGHISIETLRESLIKKFQKYQSSDAVDQPEDDMSEDKMEILKEVKSFERQNDIDLMEDDEDDDDTDSDRSIGGREEDE